MHPQLIRAERDVPLRSAWITRYKHKLVVFRTGGIPFEVICAMQGLAVLVNPKYGHIYVVARISEVIRIAAKKSDLLLRREYNADIGISLIPVKLIFAATV